MSFLPRALTPLAFMFVTAAGAQSITDPFPNAFDLQFAYCLEVNKLPLFEGIPPDVDIINRLSNYLKLRIATASDTSRIAEILGAEHQAQEDVSRMRADKNHAWVKECHDVCKEYGSITKDDFATQECTDIHCVDIMPIYAKHIRRCYNIDKSLPY